MIARLSGILLDKSPPLLVIGDDQGLGGQVMEKPGFLVAAKALLDIDPDPTETRVRYWLAGNLCRCTGYDKIVRAVMDAAAEMRAG